MYVAVSRFTVRSGFADQVAEAFRRRPHQVDQAPGFKRMEVLSPNDDPCEFWLVTFWENETSFQAWHRSHAFKESHSAMPKGLKLVPEKTSLRAFTLVCE